MKSFNQEASNLLLKKPTDHTYSGKHFQSPELVWKDIYTLPRCEKSDTNLPLFQDKLFVA